MDGPAFGQRVCSDIKQVRSHIGFHLCLAYTPSSHARFLPVPACSTKRLTPPWPGRRRLSRLPCSLTHSRAGIAWQCVLTPHGEPLPLYMSTCVVHAQERYGVDTSLLSYDPRAARRSPPAPQLTHSHGSGNGRAGHGRQARVAGGDVEGEGGASRCSIM